MAKTIKDLNDELAVAETTLAWIEVWEKVRAEATATVAGLQAEMLETLKEKINESR